MLDLLVGVIILIHGWFGSPSDFTTAKAELESMGYAVYTPAISNNVWIAPYQIRDTVNLAKAETGFNKVHLWGFSLGGVSSLYYSKVLGGHLNLQSLVTVDSPLYDPAVTWFNGTGYMYNLHLGDDTPGTTLYKQLIATPYTGPYYSQHLDGGVCAVEIAGVHTDIVGTDLGRTELAEALQGVC